MEEKGFVLCLDFVYEYVSNVLCLDFACTGMCELTISHSIQYLHTRDGRIVLSQRDGDRRENPKCHPEPGRRTQAKLRDESRI